MKKYNHLNGSTILATFLLVGFCFSLLPILYAGFFAHPLADDYSYSYRVHHAIANGDNLLSAIAETVSHTYLTWQGTFSATAIFSVQPAVFSSSLYFLTPWIMIGLLSFSTFFFFETVIRKILRSKTSYAIIISCLTLILSIQYVPSINEGFYWFNGSSYYTLFYSLSLIYLTLLLRLRAAPSEKKRTFDFVLSLILGLIIGGGNYSTALITAELVFSLAVIAFYNRSNDRWLISVSFIVFLAAFTINVTAPGNTVRAEAVTGLSPAMAIAQSLFYALGKICAWTQVPQMIFILSVAILSVFIVPLCTAKFNKPILAIIFAYLLFASQLTPPLYAMSSIGSGRQVNIYYYSYYLLISFSVFYLCGWLHQRLTGNTDEAVVSSRPGLDLLIRKNLWAITIVLCIIMGANAYEHGLLQLTSFQTTKAALDGTLAEYDKEYYAIEEKLNAGSGNLVIEDIKTVPPFFSDLDLSEDPEYWTNKAIAMYYEVESIKTAASPAIEGDTP